MSAIDAEVGHPDIRKFLSSIRTAKDDRELQRIVNEAVGPTKLMEFMRFNQGEALQRVLGPNAPNVVRLLIGNPLTMTQMAKHVPDAGSYAPVTVLVDERKDGVHISYDRVASLIGPYQNAEALAVARALDAKVENLITAAAQ
ncbi:MAG TPA: DUF302 domain-containing protein [Pyrinomonadaceae bacterium]|nr:DUF302 domain-containing protein [Pyrinomonadaceae bacterium]